MKISKILVAAVAAVACVSAASALSQSNRSVVGVCPRCGKMTVKDRLHTNATSRHASVFVCDICGTDEAIRDLLRNPLPLREWAIAKMSHQK